MPLTSSAAFSTQGRRPYQHDRHLISDLPSASLLAVADGHGPEATGHLVSSHIVQALQQTLQTHSLLPTIPRHTLSSDTLTRAIHDLDRSAIAITSQKAVYAGSTLCAVLHNTYHDRLHVFNVGDSRALLLSIHPQLNRPHLRPLSTDHVPTHPQERARVERAGGVVCASLLNGYISMTRALGDDDLKTHRNHTPFPVHGPTRHYSHTLFTSDPDLVQVDLSTDDLCIVIASDGVWGTLSNTRVSDIILRALAHDAGPDQIARAVVNAAYKKGSKDNITAVVSLLVPLHVAQTRAKTAKNSKHAFSSRALRTNRNNRRCHTTASIAKPPVAGHELPSMQDEDRSSSDGSIASSSKATSFSPISDKSRKQPGRFSRIRRSRRPH